MSADIERPADAEFEQVFALREQAIRDPNLRSVYAEVVQRLRGEAASRPAFGTLEALMVERVAFLYVWIRDREAMGIGTDGVNPEDPTHRPGFVHERTYRETLKDWFDMASKLQRAEARDAPDDDFIKDKVLQEVGRVIHETIEEKLPMAEGKAFQATLVERFDDLDF